MKRSILSLAASALALLMPYSVYSATTINMSTVVWIGYAPLYVAQEKDMFAAYDVAVELDVLSDNAAMTEALIDGSAHAATLTYDEVLRVTAMHEVGIKVVMPIDYSNGGDAIVATRDIASVTDLKGKKVGYNYLSPSDILMSYALHKHGLSEQDIISTNIPADSIQSALESARINAGATYEPNVSIIKSLSGGNKYHVIFSSKEAPGLITDTLVFRSDFIQQNPQAVTGVIKGFLDGLAYMNEHPDEAAKIISMMTGTPVGSVAADLKTVYLPSLEEMPNVFKQSADISSFFSSGKLIGELLQNKQAIKSLPKIEDTFDASFVDNLLKAR